MFLAFQNKENKPMLDYLMNWYNEFLGKLLPNKQFYFSLD